jgi:hypothetical protein
MMIPLFDPRAMRRVYVRQPERNLNVR